MSTAASPEIETANEAHENEQEEGGAQVEQVCNLAEELIKEMPDMEAEIVQELILQPVVDNIKSEDLTTSESSSEPKETVAPLESSPTKSTKLSLLDELKKFRIKKRENEHDNEEHKPDTAQLDSAAAAAPAILQLFPTERKSIIEIHIANEGSIKMEPLNETEERLNRLKQQSIIELDKLRQEEKLAEQKKAVAAALGKAAGIEGVEQMDTAALTPTKTQRSEEVVDDELEVKKIKLDIDAQPNDADTEEDIEAAKATQESSSASDSNCAAAVITNGNQIDSELNIANIDNGTNLSALENANSIADVYEDEHLALTELEINRDKELRASNTSFVQHLPCFKLLQAAPGNETANISKCRECRRRRLGTPSSEVYCRFFEFRRLKYIENEQLAVAGFPNPYTDPSREDLNIWKPDEHTHPTAGYMDIQVCRYILLHAGDQFCYLWRQEAEAVKLHENPNGTIAWKKVVQGIREICDVCDTTLFNYHWTCDKCGFGVCIDCFKDRKENRIKAKPSQRGKDEYHWILCGTNPTNCCKPMAQKHELSGLMLTQIIAGDSLNILGRLLHDIRTQWQIPQVCGCLLSQKQMPADDELSIIIKDMIKESQLKQQTAASSLATEATIRKQKQMEALHSKKLEFARAKGIDYVPGRVWTKDTLGKDPITHAFDNCKHINFLRKGLAGLRRFLPPRAMTLAQSRLLAPGVPHEWLCDGKLLRLTNPMHPDNRILYQEVWKCGQPVMISEVARSLNLDLWHPEAFCRDFGDKPNDLINCLSGNLVPNQPMRHFWQGFQCISKRLLDANGKPMLLKLKDWPPGDDFAEILPTRFSDLMKGLPMPEYTLRTGNLNIASCLPKMFVPPDLGPKMYNAYGSALHPDKGTTNLHLDISDAVNIMVYVGIPKDSDQLSQLAATQKAIGMGGCDFITRCRTQSSEAMPGALWHIFPARDADKIRDLLNRVTLEKGYRLEPDHDPIHDQNWYLDDKLRARLFNEYGVEGYPIVQCLGDAVFIPAGAPHQVQNLHNCIKVAEDFVSPENITHCYHLTHEFRRLSHSHTNHEDKLQIKNIIYHAIKDCCTILERALEKRIDDEIAAQLQIQQQKQHSLAKPLENAVEFVSNLNAIEAE